MNLNFNSNNGKDSGGKNEEEKDKKEENNNTESQAKSSESTESTEASSLSSGEVKIYTSKPVERLKMGRFRFTDGILRLNDSKDIKEFEELLDKQPERERARIKTVSLSAAEDLVRHRRPAVSRQSDSSAGRYEPDQNQVVGTKELGES